MHLFLIGLVILLGGGALYGRYCQRVFSPSDRPTPAYSKQDGVDFVPMKKWRNSLVQLLDIAGTGPILGPIQGILFGPIAFILIPVGCVIGGALHDYFVGMISVREGGKQMPSLVRKYLSGKLYAAFNIFVVLVLLLFIAVLVYTPGDIFVGQVLNLSTASNNIVLWMIYGLIFLYYIMAALLPLDKLIGRIYPLFGLILLLATLSIFIMMLVRGYSFEAYLPVKENLIPMFFVTVACGIVSGFHATQSTIIARSLSSEREGRTVFYNMMILEGFIAMVWAGAALGIYNSGLAQNFIGTPAVVGLVAKDLLGTVAGAVAIIGIIILPITSGDTAMRSLRLIICEALGIENPTMRFRLVNTLSLSAIVAVLLIFAKLLPSGFTVLWQYFAWCNQIVATFGFAVITRYLLIRRKNFWIALIPGTFYAFILANYIIIAPFALNLSVPTGYLIGAICAGVYFASILLIKPQNRFY